MKINTIKFKFIKNKKDAKVTNKDLKNKHIFWNLWLKWLKVIKIILKTKIKFEIYAITFTRSNDVAEEQ